MNPKPPASLSISGQRYKIRLRDISENHGEFDSDRHTIYLDSGQSPEDAHRTLFHECIHACLFRSGHHFELKEISEGLEEAIVRAIEHGLADLVYFRATKRNRRLP